MAERADRWAARILAEAKSRPWVHALLKAVFFAEFAALFAFLLWKCPFGFGDADESFFLTVSWRLLRGDRLFLHEWHMAQMGFFTMIPEMWLYLQFSPTTEGMILTFRYLFTVSWCAGSLFMYFRARTIHEYGARCACLFLMCYAPFGIMAFSYNSLAILYLTNAAVFLLCAKRAQKVQFALSGLFFAGAVLCCPYLASVYLVYSAALGIARLRGKRPVIRTSGADAAVCWRYFTLGAGILAAVFLAAVFVGTSPAKVLDSFRHAVHDAEHPEFSLITKGTDYFSRIGQSNAFFYPALGTVVLMTILSLRQRRMIWFAVVCAAVTLYLRRFLQEYGYMNFMMFPLTFGGLYVMLVTKDRTTRQVGLLWLVPGLMYTFCLNYSSNQFFYAISSAASVSSTASLFLMWRYCGELKEEVYQPRPKGKALYLGAYLALLLCFGFQMRYEIPIRYQSVYWEPGLMDYEEHREITSGLEKGIIATVPKAEKYETMCRDIHGVSGKRLLVLSEQVWLYLAEDNEMSTYSGWLWRVNDYAMNRLEEYYETVPEKRPEVIFLETLTEESEVYAGYLEARSRFDEEHYRFEQLESGNYLIYPRAAEE